MSTHRSESPVALVATRIPRRMLHPSPARVARWMLAEIERRGGFLAEATAALEIVRLFDGPFVVVKPDGRYTLSPSMMRTFRRIAADRVRWDAAGRGWRLDKGKG
jgi:hypothetical protein